MRRTAKDGPALDLGDGNHYRSTWERNIARLMEAFGIEASYEPKRFYFREIHESYLPDWRLRGVEVAVGKEFYSEVYIELKGYLDNKSKRQLRNIKKYYSKKGVMVILIDSDQYQRLQKEYSARIRQWEHERERDCKTERSDKPHERVESEARGGSAEAQVNGSELQQDRGETGDHQQGRSKEGAREGTGEQQTGNDRASN